MWCGSFASPHWGHFAKLAALMTQLEALRLSRLLLVCFRFGFGMFSPRPLWGRGLDSPGVFRAERALIYRFLNLYQGSKKA
jgi:hypothetical protein